MSGEDFIDLRAQLNEEQMMNAISSGVRSAFLEMVARCNDVAVMEAIQEGTYQAVWQMIINATDAPCADFYACIENGVERAMRVVGKEE